MNRLCEYFNNNNPSASLEDLEDGAGAHEPDTPQSIEDLEILKTTNANIILSNVVKATCDRLKLSAYLFPVAAKSKALPDNLIITASHNGRTVTEPTGLMSSTPETHRDSSGKRRRPADPTSRCS